MKINCFLGVFVAFCTLSLSLFSCGGSSSGRAASGGVDTLMYFSGKFIYMADAAVFKDCLTGFTFAVNQKNDYINAEKGYMALEPQMGEYIFAEFYGEVEQSVLENGEGLPYSVTIDSLIGFDRAKDCAESLSIPGVYTLRENENVISLRITGNYIFEQTEWREGAENAVISTGSWGRTRGGMYVLDYDEKNGQPFKEKVVFRVITDEKIAVERDSGEIVLEKVYL